MKTINNPSTLDCGLERGAVQIPTFAKLYIDTVGFIFIFCSCVIYRCLNMCNNNPHMFDFKVFALFWYCNTSNAAHRTREEAPWRAALETLLTMEKEYTEILCRTF